MEYHDDLVLDVLLRHLVPERPGLGVFVGCIIDSQLLGIVRTLHSSNGPLVRRSMFREFLVFVIHLEKGLLCRFVALGVDVHARPELVQGAGLRLHPGVFALLVNFQGRIVAGLGFLGHLSRHVLDVFVDEGMLGNIVRRHEAGELNGDHGSAV